MFAVSDDTTILICCDTIYNYSVGMIDVWKMDGFCEEWCGINDSDDSVTIDRG